MANRELNKKLSEWALITHEQIQKWVRNGGHYSVEWESLQSLQRLQPYPNFTESLDACYKWLMPKLDGWTVSKHINEAEYKASVFVRSMITLTHMSCADSPALALCLAIEKLIDSKPNRT